jgi:hypothetical protein
LLKYHLSDFYWFYLLVPIFWLTLFFLIKPIVKRLFKLSETNKIGFYFYLIAVSFSYLGLTIGLLIGLSLSPVIGVVIPALLTFFGGFTTYIFVFGKKTPEEGYLMSLIIISLSLFLILGSDYGAAIRNKYTNNKDEYDYKMKERFEEFKNNLLYEKNNTAPIRKETIKHNADSDTLAVSQDKK